MSVTCGDSRRAVDGFMAARWRQAPACYRDGGGESGWIAEHHVDCTAAIVLDWRQTSAHQTIKRQYRRALLRQMLELVLTLVSPSPCPVLLHTRPTPQSANRARLRPLAQSASPSLVYLDPTLLPSSSTSLLFHLCSSASFPPLTPPPNLLLFLRVQSSPTSVPGTCYPCARIQAPSSPRTTATLSAALGLTPPYLPSSHLFFFC